jgi:[protein-PII] uridylyltransferase
VDSVQRMVRHHLLLPDTATHRDLTDPATVRTVVTAVSGSAGLLELLHALSEADARATGAGVWTDWKAGLVAELVRRVARSLAGAPSPGAGRALPADLTALAEAGEVAFRVSGDQVTAVVPDAPGLLSRAAGVLALHALDVRSADVSTLGSSGVMVFTVAPRFGRPPEPELLTADLRRAVAGQLRLAERIATREASYPPPASPGPPPRVIWLDEAATDATVLELRAADTVGLLYRVTAALERFALDVRSARVETLGTAVVDAFYLVGEDGKPVIEPDLRAHIRDAVLEAAEPAPA